MIARKSSWREAVLKARRRLQRMEAYECSKTALLFPRPRGEASQLALPVIGSGLHACRVAARVDRLSRNRTRRHSTPCGLLLVGPPPLYTSMPIARYEALLPNAFVTAPLYASPAS